MIVLVDTQVFLWMNAEPERIGPNALGLLQDTGNELLFSAASAWEIAIKHGLGRLQLPDPPHVYVPDRIRSLRLRPLPIHHAHALATHDLPLHHRDPFDRILVAQGRLEDAPIMTSDPSFGAYEVNTISAMA